ncbi:hypothetical protein C8R45DRAFT_939978 [Mycena sanguinolenta]|nr:hypothetical protein C8R45DRAFT_939978 [Mycena sanguinolenta]
MSGSTLRRRARDLRELHRALDPYNTIFVGGLSLSPLVDEDTLRTSSRFGGSSCRWGDPLCEALRLADAERAFQWVGVGFGLVGEELAQWRLAQVQAQPQGQAPSPPPAPVVPANANHPHENPNLNGSPPRTTARRISRTRRGRWDMAGEEALFGYACGAYEAPSASTATGTTTRSFFFRRMRIIISRASTSTSDTQAAHLRARVE